MSSLDLSDVADRFWSQVIERRDEPALVSGGAAITYGELARLVQDASDRIGELDLAADEPVALLIEKSAIAVAYVLACLSMRRRFLLPSAKLAPPTLAALVAQAGCRYSFRGDGRVVPSVDVHDGVGAPFEPLDDVAMMLTTSGSTGLPKIVPVGRRAASAFAEWAGAAFAIGAGTVVLNYAPLNFDLCLLDIWTSLANGACVVLVSADESVRPKRIAQLIDEHKVEVLQAVPMCFGLLSEVEAHFDTVREVAFTGDAIAPRILARLREQFPNARLFNIYGCTETNDSFIHQVGADESPSASVPLGRPLPGVRAVIVGDDARLVVGAGRGELYVRTPFQTAGYLDRARNEGRFVPDPTNRTTDVFFRTGDLVRRDAEGRTVLIGRSDFQVKVRGVAVNTAEVERVLLEHPQVEEAVVVAEADILTGHRLLCAVRRQTGSALHSLELRQHCIERLPQAAVPSGMTILDEALPRTSTGKPDRQAVAELRRHGSVHASA
jgi:amino acid adenylation domain-containing protein